VCVCLCSDGVCSSDGVKYDMCVCVCVCSSDGVKLVTHWFVGLEFAKSDGIKNVDLTYDIQSFTDLGRSVCLSISVSQ